MKKMRYIFDTPKTAEIGSKNLPSKDLIKLWVTKHLLKLPVEPLTCQKCTHLIQGFAEI